MTRLGGETAHLLDDVAAGGPQVAEVGDVGLEGEGVDPVLLELLDEVEAVLVAAMEVDTNRGRPVEAGGEGEGLPDPAVFAGPGDEDSLALEARPQVGPEAEEVFVDAVHPWSIRDRRPVGKNATRGRPGPPPRRQR